MLAEVGPLGAVVVVPPDRFHAARALVRARQDHTLISLLARNGLRMIDALGDEFSATGSERGHTPTVLRTAGKIVTMPPAPRTPRSLGRQ